MAKPKKLSPKLNEMKKEIIEKNFLAEEIEEIPTEVKVVVSREVPKYEKIIFQNNRDPGCTLYFHYASKTHPLKHYTLAHGFQYDLPVEVIKHLEGENATDPYSCHSRLYGSRQTEQGGYEPYVNGYKSYFQCKAVRA